MRAICAGHEVAIKVLAEHSRVGCRAEGAVYRGKRRYCASLNHSHIAATYGLEDRAWVMELVEGLTLADRMRDGQLVYCVTYE